MVWIKTNAIIQRAISLIPIHMTGRRSRRPILLDQRPSPYYESSLAIVRDF
jgi:hypothetical protein